MSTRLPLHLAVRRLASANPDAIALVHDTERVSYRTLAEAGDNYARLLSSWGVRQGDIVALMLPRSAQLVAVQLGVLACGAAYTGIDPRWPASRVSSILDQLDAPVVVGRTPGDIEGRPVRVIAPESVMSAAADPAPYNSPEVSLDDAATVFFTSGTTGVSKGVVTTHRAVTRMFGTAGLDGFGPGHVTPQAAPLPWDMYAFELWGQLSTGGTSVIVGEDYLMPRRLRALVADEGVDTLWLTTSLFNLFVDEDVDSFAGLKQLYVGGEKQSPAHVGRYLERFADVPIWNGYGPAENCMLTTLHRMGPADLSVPGGIPLGRIVPGTDVVVVRDDGSPAPAEETGEILVTGGGLALGYVNDPVLTGTKFIEIEVDGETRRAYRTGDMGLFDSDGVLHYRDRIDRQIKLNGNRLELGDIESAARRVEAIRTCAAVAVRDDNGQVQHIALYYSTDADHAGLTPRELRKQLATMLPAYAIPTAMERLDALPISANGKVDLRALGERGRR
ncbi:MULTISPECIES: amino acid adenylation domain-containing protein [unclassified Streptomyces]|uniref:amino acid adenylation domain-containing protein n=1 Tax=unclassified Streptomyces TaxID=2593676 RepID=UPI001BEACBD0|nr:MULTISPECIES: amino acid adenylation domain-containing protein [unclassified Streptomyces]MBT2408169.1 amino acid adenylation domain-containing protein [Streptomyces sp. ISL-21]MBT2609273.1 amino acid adenylation domain-containing protein [Streptomyces sp. ISL-87]